MPRRDPERDEAKLAHLILTLQTWNTQLYDPLELHGLIRVMNGRMWIAGGHLRDRNLKRRDSDIDLWVWPKESYELLRHSLTEIGGYQVMKELENYPGRQGWTVTKLARLDGYKWETMQHVDLIYGAASPEECIAHFDYTVNCIAAELILQCSFDAPKNISRWYAHPDFFDHIQRKVLIPIDNEHNIPYARLVDMERKGFRRPGKKRPFERSDHDHDK